MTCPAEKFDVDETNSLTLHKKLSSVNKSKLIFHEKVFHVNKKMLMLHKNSIYVMSTKTRLCGSKKYSVPKRVINFCQNGVP